MSTGLRLRRGAAAGLSALALAGAGLLLTAAPAQAAACTSTSSGVTVVVTNPSGGTSVRCSPGDPASGAAALTGAGFSMTQVQTQPGFVCRIDGAPASDPCVRVPPTTAYWSYWYAQPGGSWTYSSAGAYGRNPAPGTVEGWAFGAGSPPSVAPPSVAAPAPPPAPAPSTTAPKPAPAPSTASPAAPRPSTSTSSAPRSTSDSSSPAPAAASTAPAAGADASPATPPSGDESGNMKVSPSPGQTFINEDSSRPTAIDTAAATAAGPPTGDDSGSSSAAPTLAGLGVAGALLGAAGWMGWRRRIGD